MKFASIVVFLCLVAAISAAPRIFGGKNAPLGKYPYQVSLKYYGLQHVCGGSILNKHWILTAAHCIQKFFPHEVVVMIGSNTLNSASIDNHYTVKYMVSHKDFDEETHLQDDIGLLRLNREIEFSDRVKPINLPKSNIGKDGDHAVLTGWGQDQNSRYPNMLKEVDLKIYDQDKCRSYYAEEASDPVDISDKQICVRDKVGQGACSGDSGGPLVVDGVQVGITSFIDDYCGVGYPEVYTRVYSYLDWIKEHMKNYEQNLV